MLGTYTKSLSDAWEFFMKPGAAKTDSLSADVLPKS